MTRWAGVSAAAVVFVWLATANSGGYRFGVSDQAFYAAAVVKDLHPTSFPRDTPLLETQSQLMWADEIVAGIVRAAGTDLPPVYVGLYVVSLLALVAAALAFGRAAGFSVWASGALLVLLTFRHRIAKTGANSLEGYMHPRMLAFALGVAALAAVVRGRLAWAVVATAAAAVWHPTTAFWFGIVVAVAAMDRPRLRPWLIGLGVISAGAGVWLLQGVWSGRLVTMDPAWVAVLAEKDYLFPTAWPAYAWLTNLSYVAIVVAIYQRRVRLGVAASGERALVGGLLALFAVFVATVPFTAWRVALAVQAQATRAFWVLDFVAVAYVAWWLLTDVARSRSARAAVGGVLLAASIGRGIFLLNSAQSNRDLVTPGFAATPWTDAMAWLRSQPSGWHVLADPGHGWKYGVSVRLAAEKDTVLEIGKDSALAMYDRAIAMRVAERRAALADYGAMTLERLRALDARYDLDVAVFDVTDARHPVPELYRNGQFVIYDLR